MLNILVADDEEIARQTIELLVRECLPDAKISFAKDGKEAEVYIANHHFDIVFLDIQMPQKTGLEVAKSVAKKTAIVFVTAYDAHAIEAFSLNAIDYVLKPVEDNRFAQAVDKATYYLRAPENVQSQKRQELQSTVSSLLNKHKKIVLKEVGKIKLIEQREIKFIAGAGNYIEIHLVDGRTLLQRETLSSIEQKLDASMFSRIHKSTIIRNELVVELRPTPKGDYVVKLRSGEEVMLSRRNKDKLEDIL